MFSEIIDNIYSLLLKAQEDARKDGEKVESMTDTHIFQTLADIFFGNQNILSIYGDFKLLAKSHIMSHDEA